MAKLLGQTGITRTGTTLGTVAYMSPEQTRGLEVDARSDLWSLGVVLYEMIAGPLPFKGNDTFSIANAIVHDTPPPLTSLRTGVPMELDRIVARGLAKRPDDRYQTAAEFLSELRRLKRESDQGRATAIATTLLQIKGKRRIALGAAATSLLAGVLLFRTASSRVTSSSTVPRLANPIQVAGSVGFERHPSWSPDGKMLAYSNDMQGLGRPGEYDVRIAQVGGGPPLRRAEYSGSPNWSPDGHDIAVWSDREGGGIFVMPALAGTPRKITAASDTTWSPDASEIAYAMSEAGMVWLERRNLQSGATKRSRFPGRTVGRTDLAWSPDGRYLAYVDATLGSDVTQLWVLNLRNGTGQPFTPVG